MRFLPDQRMSQLSTQYVKVYLVADSAGEVVDPTSGTVSFSFVDDNTANPDADSWHQGSWVTTDNGEYLARILVGPSGVVTLVPATYTVWVKIELTPETVIQSVCELTVA